MDIALTYLPEVSNPSNIFVQIVSDVLLLE
jgi:hypothetical protein